MRAVLRVLGQMGLLAFAACGGRAKDTTILSGPSPDEPAESQLVEPPRSAALDALGEPAAREAFCGWVGASAASVAGTPLDCARVAEGCRQAASEVASDGSLDVVSGLLGASGDLDSILGCPVSFDVVDSCLAQLVELSVDRYPGGASCGMSTPVEPLGVNDLTALPSCITVAVNCPELLRQLLAARR